jgi:hypothetical protein
VRQGCGPLRVGSGRIAPFEFVSALGRTFPGEESANGIANEPLGTARHMSPISVGGDMTSVDPTLLRGREVSHLHPTIFARDDAEFGVLSNHADSSR